MDTLIAYPQTHEISKKELFLCFLYIGLVSFGGALPWARRILVEERNWLTSEEFSDALSLGQVLPGPNVVNLSIMLGVRFQGPLGAILAFSGLMLAPLAIILMLAVLYEHYGQVAGVQNAIHGTAAASAGLVVAMGLNMVIKQAKSWHSTGITVLAFIGSGVVALPLLLVLGVLVPVSIFLSWWKQK
jgi:chromate transporter